jgi:hypothetical protein
VAAYLEIIRVYYLLVLFCCLVFSLSLPHFALSGLMFLRVQSPSHSSYILVFSLFSFFVCLFIFIFIFIIHAGGNMELFFSSTGCSNNWDYESRMYLKNHKFGYTIWEPQVELSTAVSFFFFNCCRIYNNRTSPLEATTPRGLVYLVLDCIVCFVTFNFYPDKKQDKKNLQTFTISYRTDMFIPIFNGNSKIRKSSVTVGLHYCWIMYSRTKFLSGPLLF